MLLAGHVDDPLCGMCFGIVYIREATPTIRNSRIVSSAYTGIAIYESAVCIEDNVLSSNSAGASGGGAILVDCYREAPRIVRNTFEGSNASSSGGAIFTTATAVHDPTPACAAMAIVTGNVFRSNAATQSGVAPSSWSSS
jgi:predicted outer membrane repeat protein